VFVLACGAPIGAVVGAVDAMRVGADVAPWWSVPSGQGELQPGYEATTPATCNAFVNTCTRSFMHRRLWSNDPDCVMLRRDGTQLTEAAATAWGDTVGCSGGLVLVSDDLARLGPDARRRLEDIVERGRAADVGSLAGHPPRCDGLLDITGPTGLIGSGGRTRVDPATGRGGLV
jgi:alpha-galactosidase